MVRKERAEVASLGGELRELRGRPLPGRFVGVWHLAAVAELPHREVDVLAGRAGPIAVEASHGGALPRASPALRSSSVGNLLEESGRLLRKHIVGLGSLTPVAGLADCEVHVSTSITRPIAVLTCARLPA